jgi:hypothetical protein
MVMVIAMVMLVGGDSLAPLRPTGRDGLVMVMVVESLCALQVSTQFKHARNTRIHFGRAGCTRSSRFTHLKKTADDGEDDGDSVEGGGGSGGGR